MIEASTKDHAIIVDINRHKDGIRLHVRMWPEVEEFFAHWSGGQQERPQFGRLWRMPDGSQPLLWSLGLSIGLTPSQPFSLAHTGAAFHADGFPNISFLRLVGASSPEGRSIIIDTVAGRSELRPTAQKLSDAFAAFYSEYLLPVNMRAFVGVDRLPNSVAA